MQEQKLKMTTEPTLTEFEREADFRIKLNYMKTKQEISNELDKNWASNLNIAQVGM